MIASSFQKNSQDLKLEDDTFKMDVSFRKKSLPIIGWADLIINIITLFFIKARK